jgi:hypothetical protein
VHKFLEFVHVLDSDPPVSKKFEARGLEDASSPEVEGPGEMALQEAGGHVHAWFPAYHGDSSEVSLTLLSLLFALVFSNAET